jgi:Tfp pilus assembly protein PilV
VKSIQGSLMIEVLVSLLLMVIIINLWLGLIGMVVKLHDLHYTEPWNPIPSRMVDD